MLINLNRDKFLFSKKKLKKKYFFYSFICSKSRIKFRHNENAMLVKINNNMSIIQKKSKSINIKILESRISIYSENLKEVNEFARLLKKFCKTVSFL